MKYCYMLQYGEPLYSMGERVGHDWATELTDGWTLRTKVKETRHKRPPIVWFHLYEISRINKSVQTESELVVVRGWEEMGIKTNW